MGYSVAIIPDGNRRYARKMDIPLKKAYELGFKKAEDLLDWCLERGDIEEVTLWGLSTENFRRNKTQLKLLNKMFREKLSELLDSEKLIKNKVRVRIVGDAAFLKTLSPLVEKIHEKTKHFNKFKLNIALAYGGKHELTNAFNELAKEGKKRVTEKDVEKHLMIPNPVDLIIRTSGMQRLSGYLLWQAAYAELYFSKKFWPEFTKAEFNKAINFLKTTKRNFGK
jgi:undecaprenyl diphosphate synthase